MSGPDFGGHLCDESCICPIHRDRLLYAPGTGEHACQHQDCEYAHELPLPPMHPWDDGDDELFPGAGGRL